ncbi:MAG: phosphate ABC transporter substrate-binding protein [Nitrospirota bacterium]
MRIAAGAVFTFCCSCVVSILFAGIGASPLGAETITASGCSVSNSGYLADLAREYEKRTGVRILLRGGGSVVGLEDLRSGKVDLAASCRVRMSSDPPDIEFVQVAWDALVFVVHPANPVESITLDDARALYAGQIVNWKQLKGRDAPVKLFISRPQRGLSGVGASLRDMVLKGKDTVRTPHSVSLASTGIVEQMVEKTPDGFAATGFSSARKRAVKMLKINGVQPIKETIAKGSYPLQRPLFILAPKRPKPAVRRFVDFVLSAEGQRLISGMGALSLSDAPGAR